MKATSNFDADKREIYAQSGVIKDELNEFLKPYGLFSHLSYQPQAEPA